MLAISVYEALRQAVSSHTPSREPVHMNAPATAEEVLGTLQKRALLASG
jgi:xanthine dehydrogenase molybdopterin-binding subunit B